MRNIKYIAIHCTAGSLHQKARDVVYFHTGPTAKGCKGWSAPGYHYIVESDGNVVPTWPEDKISNGVKGYNAVTINVCWTGGVDLTRPGNPPVDNRTAAQRAALRILVANLHRRYPGAVILGHRDFPGVHKACPCFDVKTEYKDL